MPYQEPNIVDEDGEETLMPGAEYMPNLQTAPYRSNENAFIKHLTERHIPGELGEEHKDRWMHRTVYSGKERSTAFFEDPRSLQLINVSRENLGLIETLDEDELKWQHTYDMIDLSVTTHGQHGNLIKALTIKRQEFEDKSRMNEEQGLLQKIGSSLKGNQEQQAPEQGVVRY